MTNQPTLTFPAPATALVVTDATKLAKVREIVARKLRPRATPTDAALEWERKLREIGRVVGMEDNDER